MRFLLLFVALAVSSQAFAADPCRGLHAARLIFPLQDVTESRNERLHAIVDSAARRAGVRNLLICETAKAIQNAATFWIEEKGIRRYVLLFNQEVVAALSDNALTAISAHEIAHIIRRSRIKCSRVCAAMIAEEIATDLLAARWVGTVQVISGLEELHAYLEPRYPEFALPGLRREMRARLQALRESQ